MPRVQFSSMSQLGEALPLLISYQPQNAMAVALFTEGCFAGACVVPLCDSPDELLGMLMGALDMTREAARNGRGHRVMVVPVLFGTLRSDCADLFAAWKLVVEVESGEPVEHVVTVAGPVASCSCGVCDDHRVDVPSELTGAMTRAGCKVHPTRDDLGTQVAISPVAAQLVADWLAAHAAVSEAEGRAAWAALLSGCKPSVARAAQALGGLQYEGVVSGVIGSIYGEPGAPFPVSVDVEPLFYELVRDVPDCAASLPMLGLGALVASSCYKTVCVDVIAERARRIDPAGHLLVDEACEEVQVPARRRQLVGWQLA